jgi:predicted  nucleic acid-binding Zn-ribbon protein
VADDVANLILQELQAMVGDVARLDKRLDALALGLNSLEGQVARLSTYIGDLGARMDTVDHHLDRIERRLGLADVAA